MTSKVQIAILGGGLSGLAAGYQLAVKGFCVSVFEASDQAGGLAGTSKQGPYSLDFGPHSFFTEDSEVREFVLSLFQPVELKASKRKARFFYQGQYLDYPFTPVALLKQMGIRDCLKILAEGFAAALGRAWSLKEADLSVEDWCLKNFGPTLYEHFFKPYTEQFWLIPAKELSVRALPAHTRSGFLNALKTFFISTVNSGSLSQIDREKLPPYFPLGGYGEIASRMADRLVQSGGAIHFKHWFDGLACLDAGGVRVRLRGPQGRIEKDFDFVISTLPLPFLIKKMDGVSSEVLEASKRLEYRPLIFLGLVTPKENLLPCDYAYVLAWPYNRMTEMNKFSEKTSPEGENVLALEIPCRRQDALWGASRDELFEKCIGFLEKDGILRRGDVQGLLLVKNPHAYPIYRMGYEQNLRKSLRYLDSLGSVATLGRNAEFLYLDGDQCIRRAFDWVERFEARLGPEQRLGLRCETVCL